MSERTNLTEELEAAEGLIAAGEGELAIELLERLADDAEEYADRNCVANEDEQWFSFPTPFERLCYRRIEGIRASCTTWVSRSTGSMPISPSFL